MTWHVGIEFAKQVYMTGGRSTQPKIPEFYSKHNHLNFQKVIVTAYKAYHSCMHSDTLLHVRFPLARKMHAYLINFKIQKRK